MKYNEDMVRDIEAGFKAGLSQRSVCDLVGISTTTFHKWLEKAEFTERVKRATARQKKDLIEKIQKSGEKSWQALAWLLERCYPGEFGIRVRNEHTGIDGEDIKIKVAFKDPDAD